MTESQEKQGKSRKKTSFIGRLFQLLIILLIVAASVVATGAWWIHAPLTMSNPIVAVEVKPGSSPREVVKAVVDAGIKVSPQLLYQFFKWSGKSRYIRAGLYEFNAHDTPSSLLTKLVLGGQTVVYKIVFPEGWTFAQIRQRLNESVNITHQTVDMSDQQIMEALGMPDLHPEGVFFPDTYIYSPGNTDLHILRRSMSQMDNVLTQAWNEREEGLPLKTPYEALILASIIEKETGRDSERFMVAGVFINRLRKGMLLQTDPTVIYGLGRSYTGRITRANLKTDTPYNTYTRLGLTPTPIAMPSKKSILAALHPAKTAALYFVARGDGTSHFSDTLNDHNQAVNHYIRGRGRAPRASSGIIEP